MLLEAAGAGTALGSAKAVDRLATMLWGQEREDLRMEAVLILTELRAPGGPRNSEPCRDGPTVRGLTKFGRPPCGGSERPDFGITRSACFHQRP